MKKRPGFAYFLKNNVQCYETITSWCMYWSNTTFLFLCGQLLWWSGGQRACLPSDDLCSNPCETLRTVRTAQVAVNGPLQNNFFSVICCSMNYFEQILQYGSVIYTVVMLLAQLFFVTKPATRYLTGFVTKTKIESFRNKWKVQQYEWNLWFQFELWLLLSW